MEKKNNEGKSRKQGVATQTRGKRKKKTGGDIKKKNLANGKKIWGDAPKLRRAVPTKSVKNCQRGLGKVSHEKKTKRKMKKTSAGKKNAQKTEEREKKRKTVHSFPSKKKSGPFRERGSKRARN